MIKIFESAFIQQRSGSSDNSNSLGYFIFYFFYFLHVYVSADSNLIDPSHTVKDLGVLMSNDCMFDEHICQVTKKCSQLCGWILRTFENRSELLMLTLFKSIVLSRIDYASQLWSPYKKSYICELEKIQRSFTKYIAGYQNLPYSETEISTVVLPPEAERPLLSDLHVEDCRGIGT